MLRPPQHDIETEGRWIFPHDPSVDHERINHEKRVMESRQSEILEHLAREREKDERDHEKIATLEAKADEQEPTHHPWEVYQGGDTRYHLDETVRSYAPGATEFVLKRVSRATWRVLSDQIAAFQAEKKPKQAAKLRREFARSAIQAGVVRAENTELQLDYITLKERDIDTLEELHGALPITLAFAVFNYSRGLLASEKKR